VDETDRLFTSLRVIHTTANEDGSATSHVIVRCTLADLARATNLRVDDAAFALNECGMLDRRGLNGEGNKGEKVVEVIAITRDMVEKVARERKVKMMYVDLAHVLL
jgi:histone acetyltransferase MYST1